MKKMSRRAWMLGNGAGLGGVAAALQGNARTFSTGTPTPVEFPLFPWPQSVEFGPRKIDLVHAGRLRVSILVVESTGPAGRRAAQMIAAELKRRTAQRVAVSTTPGSGDFQIRVSSFESGASGNESGGRGRLSLTGNAKVRGDRSERSGPWACSGDL